MSGKRGRLEAALQLLAHGYRAVPLYVIRHDDGTAEKVPPRKQVFRVPCEAHPLTQNSAFTREELDDCRACKGGVVAATRNPAFLRQVWKRLGPSAMVAVVPPPGTVALDDDGGCFDAAWSGLPRVKSQSGRHHGWFRLAEGQELSSENGVIYDESIVGDDGEPLGKVDVRTSDGTFYIGIPAGDGPYEAVDGWDPNPATWPELPAEVYERLKAAPRWAGGPGGGARAPGEGFRAGVPQAPVGGPYDRGDDAGERMADWLEKAGWSHHMRDAWTRAGKSDGVSALLGESDGIWWLRVFTTNGEPLQASAYYTASSLRCALFDGGDWEVTSAALAAEGYGDGRTDPADDFGDDPLSDDECPDCDLITACEKHVVRTGEVLPADAPEPWAFFDKEGLLAKKLADEVDRHVVYAVAAVDDKLFFVFTGGVWKPGGARVATVIAALLGDRYRRSHQANVVDMLRFAPGVRRIACDPVPKWVNLPNGLLDWKTKTLHPHDPDVLSVTQLGVDWDPDAECPAVEKFFRQVLPADCLEPMDGGPGYIWELLAYCIYSGNPFHLAVLLWGKGGNGKGVFLRLVGRLLGQENVSNVTLTDLTENRFRAADLYGKLANIAGDIDPKWLHDTAMFKTITGDDYVAAEHKYGAVFSFKPWALPMFSVNKPFGSADSSEGYLRRWEIVPFPNGFEGKEDRHLDARLARELGGVLRRAVEALPVLMERGRLPQPESVKEAKHAFVAAGDAVRSMLDEETRFDRDAWTPRTALFDRYDNTRDHNGKPMTAREFYNRLDQVGALHEAKRRGVRGYAGVRLLHRICEDDVLAGPAEAAEIAFYAMRPVS